MADLPLDTAPDRCESCEVSPARSGHTWCEECWSWACRTSRLVADETARRLVPEGWTFFIILFWAPAFDFRLLLLLIPLLCVAVIRGYVIFRRRSDLVMLEFLGRSMSVWEAQRCLSEEQQYMADFRAEMRREAVVRGIPLSGELEDALRGERSPEELSGADYDAVYPAVEAVDNRRRQRNEAYGIDAGLPFGSDPAC